LSVVLAFKALSDSLGGLENSVCANAIKWGVASRKCLDRPWHSGSVRSFYSNEPEDGLI
jgi:hypothetical protein